MTRERQGSWICTSDPRRREPDTTSRPGRANAGSPICVSTPPCRLRWMAAGDPATWNPPPEEAKQMQTTSWASTAFIALAALAGGGPAHARDKTPAVDPQAIAALEAMGSFLRGQTAMAVIAETTTDDVLPSGQKVQYAGRADLRVRRPDRFRADVNSDRKNEQLYYDGKTFTIFQPVLHYYASFDAPPTLAELADVAERRYGLDLPLADLFYWGTERSRVGEIKGAVKVGQSTVKGTPCDHWAFHQTDVDWEICIATGDRPLPRKLVITTTSER